MLSVLSKFREKTAVNVVNIPGGGCGVDIAKIAKIAAAMIVP